MRAPSISTPGCQPCFGTIHGSLLLLIAGVVGCSARASVEEGEDLNSGECPVEEDRDRDGVTIGNYGACDPKADLKYAIVRGLDDDCDDDDPDRSTTVRFYRDQDGDGRAPSTFGSIFGCEGDTIDGFTTALGDCDDDDPSVQELRLPDEDGDGFGAGTFTCVSSDAPSLTEATRDCNDQDPATQALMYFDDDGDGFASSVPRCVAWDAEGSPLAGSDCDDEDPERQVFAYLDQDGDGFGAEVVQCVSEEEGGVWLEPGFDCDDDSDSMYPGAPNEQALDEVDTNCDGRDYPVMVYSGDAPDPAPTGDFPRCDGRALSIVAVWVTEDLSHTVPLYLQIFNRGDSPVEDAWIESGTPRVGLSSTMLPPLAPGESVLSEALVTYVPHRLIIGGDRGECEALSVQVDELLPVVVK